MAPQRKTFPRLFLARSEPFRLAGDRVFLRFADDALVALPVEGTPIERMWHVSTLSPDRRSPAATKLRRFLSTPDAMHVMHRADGSVPAARFRPPVYVTLWS